MNASCAHWPAAEADGVSRPQEKTSPDPAPFRPSCVNNHSASSAHPQCTQQQPACARSAVRSTLTTSPCSSQSLKVTESATTRLLSCAGGHTCTTAAICCPVPHAAQAAGACRQPGQHRGRGALTRSALGKVMLAAQQGHPVGVAPLRGRRYVRDGVCTAVVSKPCARVLPPQACRHPHNSSHLRPVP
jgi:hypothetical protein